jgi:hypothetical protein
LLTRMPPGTAKRLADEIDKRGAYVKTVVLHSPGGSLTDALAMGRLIRDRKFATEVESGKYCASACPLVFAGGIERRAGVKAAIGVQRAVSLSSDPAMARDGIEDGQRISVWPRPICATWESISGYGSMPWRRPAIGCIISRPRTA